MSVMYWDYAENVAAHALSDLALKECAYVSQDIFYKIFRYRCKFLLIHVHQKGGRGFSYEGFCELTSS
jgi:hypothetical protein